MVEPSGEALSMVSIGTLLAQTPNEARLVRVREEGREWHYQLDAQPLAELYENWLSRFAPLWDARLAQLKDQVERRR